MLKSVLDDDRTQSKSSEGTGWKMDSRGNWTTSSGVGSVKHSDNVESKGAVDKGNTSDTDSSIADTTSNKTEKLKYAEEARFEIDGDYNVRRGAYLEVGCGVASRWKGKWLILETTHTITTRGYFTEGLVGRIPYYDESQSTGEKADGSQDGTGSGNSDKSGDTLSGNSNGSGGKWTMDPDGTWHKK